ncbi:MAG: CPBP family intramembrane metalloprotease [Bacteroidia bacterium]|nr:CPBP family intramembrane metalloprotease [Bacteroidia bacterium]
MISELITALLQVLIFCLIPFLVFLIQKKTLRGFWSWIGFRKTNFRAMFMALGVIFLLAGPMIVLTLFSPDFKEIMLDPNSVTGKIRAMGPGLDAVVIILISALIKTSLAEEIFFRGFVAKRLIAVTSFQTGNLIQALIFGAIHTLLFLAITSNALFLTVIFVFPGLGAWLKCYINEKVADGSILPGWLAHGLGNVLAYSFIAFGL